MTRLNQVIGFYEVQQLQCESQRDAAHLQGDKVLFAYLDDKASLYEKVLHNLNWVRESYKETDKVNSTSSQVYLPEDLSRSIQSAVDRLSVIPPEDIRDPSVRAHLTNSLKILRQVTEIPGESTFFQKRYRKVRSIHQQVLDICEKTIAQIQSDPLFKADFTSIAKTSPEYDLCVQIRRILLEKT